MPNEKERESGDNSSDINPNQGGDMNVVHTPKGEEKIWKTRLPINPLEELIKFGVGDFISKCVHYPNDATKKEIEELEYLNNRASNAVEALKDALPSLGKVVWMSAYENESGYLDEEVVFALGILIEMVGEALSASIRVENDSLFALHEIEKHQADGIPCN